MVMIITVIKIMLMEEVVVKNSNNKEKEDNDNKVNHEICYNNKCNTSSAMVEQVILSVILLIHIGQQKKNFTSHYRKSSIHTQQTNSYKRLWSWPFKRALHHPNRAIILIKRYITCVFYRLDSPWTWQTNKADKIYSSSGRQRNIPSLLLCKKVNMHVTPVLHIFT